ncbi:MAG: hypothetical protein IKB75_02410 [Clostridia bacterium]|nr:hypothetical protein [Clostridia bacterium]
MKLPQRNRDLRNYVLRNDVLRISLYVLWIAVWALSAYSYNTRHATYPDHRKILGWKLALLLAAAVISGFFLFRIWKFFTDCSFCGVIESTSLSHSYSPADDPSMFRGIQSGQADFHLKTVLTVRLPSGKRRRIRFVQKEGSYHYYYEGNSIVHFRGLPYPVCTERNDVGYVCAACGRMHKEKAERCDACHYTLIDPIDLQL